MRNSLSSIDPIDPIDPIIFLFKQLGLEQPEDSITFKITHSKRMVISQKLNHGNIKRSITHYPTTGTNVATEASNNTLPHR